MEEKNKVKFTINKVLHFSKILELPLYFKYDGNDGETLIGSVENGSIKQIQIKYCSLGGKILEVNFEYKPIPNIIEPKVWNLIENYEVRKEDYMRIFNFVQDFLNCFN